MNEPNGQLHPAEDINYNPNRVLDLVKLQIGFWEKLVVFDGSVLVLSFTASTFFKGHVVGDGGVGYLALAWRLLFGGIGLSGPGDVQ